ncbi:hypothetical protein GZ998_08325 [Actinomyces sp. 594]|nr:hypothetical protein [Actinomyces sp. 594]MBW3069505.1 hypothetical protein [Actinomyces sp. 594]
MHKRNSNAEASDTNSDQWSQAWLDGFEEAWSLEAPTDFRDKEISTRIHGNRLVRITSTSETATVAVFDISKNNPRQLWETQQDVSEAIDRTTIWDGRIVVENTLIDVYSQERSVAPWDADARVSITSTGAIACVDSTCRYWTSPSEMAWETDFGTDSPVTVQSSKIVDGYTLASSSDYDHFVVDLSTGATNELDTNKHTIQQPLADGWLVRSGGGSRKESTIDLYEPDGTFSESFKYNESASFSSYPWSPTPFTREQAKLWLKDLDTSWAPSSYSASETDTSCKSITINGNDIVLGKDNALFGVNRKKECASTSALQALYHSGQGQVQKFSKRDGYKLSLVLVDMVTGRASEPIPLGTTEERPSHRSIGDLLLVEFKYGKVIAYRPSSS